MIDRRTTVGWPTSLVIDRKTTVGRPTSLVIGRRTTVGWPTSLVIDRKTTVGWPNSLVIDSPEDNRPPVQSVYMYSLMTPKDIGILTNHSVCRQIHHRTA